MTFDVIARELLTQKECKVLECSSDKEEILKSDDLRRGKQTVSVHFSASDTFF